MKTIKRIKIFVNKINRNYYKISNQSLTIFISQLETNKLIKSKKFILKIQDQNFELISKTYKIKKNTKLKIIKQNLIKKNSKKNLIKYINLFIFAGIIRNISILITMKATEAIIYLIDTPIGIKQNRLLKVYFASFFIFVFKKQVELIRNIYFIFPYKIYFLHLIICCNVTTYIYKITFQILYECTNIFRGRNYNLMKKRIDRVNYSAEVITLSSLLFVFSILLMYSIIGFYILALIFKLLADFFNFFYNLIGLFIVDLNGFNYPIKIKKRKNNIIFISYEYKDLLNTQRILFFLKISKKEIFGNNYFNNIVTGNHRIKII